MGVKSLFLWRHRRLLPLLSPASRAELIARGRENELTAAVSNTSWLQRGAPGQWQCLPCVAHGDGVVGCFDSDIRLDNLKRHEKSKHNRKAVAKMLKLPEPVDLPNPNKPPNRADFAELLKHIRTGGITSAGIACMSKHKSCRARYCLSESLQTIYRSFISKCTTLNLLRDERKKRLQLSWRGGTPELVIMRGGVGLSKTHDSGAIGITEATKKMLERLCTSLKPPPYPPATVPAPIFHEDTFDHICKIGEALTIDSASDELVSAGDMQSSEAYVRNGIVAFMPNLKYILRLISQNLFRYCCIHAQFEIYSAR